MSWVPYKDLPTTTLTSVTLLNGEVENWNLYYLFPITYLRLSKSYYKKVPTCNIEGAILSVRFKDTNRGFPKDSCFKNSIILDISMGNKNVSVKLSDKKIQLCGATSEKMSIKASKILINYILKIQELLDLLHKDPVKTQNTIKWVLSVTRSDTALQRIDIKEGKKGEKIDKCKETLLKAPDNYSAYKEYEFPPNIDKTLARWFIPMISDFIQHDDYVKFLNYIQTLERVIITDTISIGLTEVKMKNHNYSIPFLMHRQKLYNLFKNREGWIAIYDASWDTSVKLLRISNNYSGENNISQALDEEEDEELLYHTFIIFSTGSVTQSGPRPDEIGIYYEEFNQIIFENKEEILMKTHRNQKKKLKPFFNYPPVIQPAFPFDKVVETN